MRSAVAIPLLCASILLAALMVPPGEVSAPLAMAVPTSSSPASPAGLTASLEVGPPPQDPVAPVLELEVIGDVVQMVRTLPVTITAPKGGSLYLWEFPAGVEGVKLGNKAEITALPENDSLITLQMQVINFEEQSFKLIPGTVTLRNGTKPPEPDPDVDPDPDPIKPLARVVIVEESSQRTAEYANLFVQIRTKMDEPTILIVDKDNQAPSLQDAIGEATKHPLPAVVGFSEDGSVVHADTCPRGFTEFQALIKDLSGDE